MYVLTIRDGLHTRHIGPYETPKQAADQLDQLLSPIGERSHWQIHQLESPRNLEAKISGTFEGSPSVAAA
jgi:hypothetical protein